MIAVLCVLCLVPPALAQDQLAYGRGALGSTVPGGPAHQIAFAGSQGETAIILLLTLMPTMPPVYADPDSAADVVFDLRANNAVVVDGFSGAWYSFPIVSGGRGWLPAATVTLSGFCAQLPEIDLAA